MTEVDLQEIRRGLEATLYAHTLTVLESMDEGKSVRLNIGIERFALLEQGLITNPSGGYSIWEPTTLTPKGQEYLNKSKETARQS